MKNHIHLTERHVQRTGGSSFTITLPKQWVLDQGTSGNTIVQMFAHPSGTLSMRAIGNNQKIKLIISLEGKSEEEISRELIGAYLAGAEEIELTSYLMNPDLRKLVRTNLYKLASFEIFETSSNSILLRYTGVSTISAKEYVLKASNIISTMLEDTQVALIQNQRATARDVVERDSEIDRINLVVIRSFNQFLATLLPQSTEVSLIELNYYKHVAIRLERIADHVVRICSTFLQITQNNPVSIPHSTIVKMKKLITTLRDCTNMIEQLNGIEANRLIDEYEQLHKNAKITHSLVHENVINMFIIDSLERIRSYIANIAEETIDYLTMCKSIESEKNYHRK